MDRISEIRRILNEGLFGIGKGPTMPKAGNIISVQIDDGYNSVKQMKVSGVEYDNSKDTFAINGFIDGKQQVVFADQIVEAEKKDLLPGGLADNKTLKDIAKKHGVSYDKIKKEFDIGIEIEMEHTNDRKKAREITLDHLEEIKDYYTRLVDMEDEAEDSSKKMEEGIEHLEDLSPEKWVKEIKKLELSELSPEDMEEIQSQAGEVEQYLRRRANTATDIRTARKYFNAVEWLEDVIFESVLFNNKNDKRLLK